MAVMHFKSFHCIMGPIHNIALCKYAPLLQGWVGTTCQCLPNHANSQDKVETEAAAKAIQRV